MSRGRLIALFLAFVVLGMLAGWLVRRWSEPTLEERAHRAAERIESDVQKRAR